MGETPSLAALDAQVIRLSSFAVWWLSSGCFFQRIVNGEVGKLGQAVEHPAVLLMVPEIKPEQDLVQVGQMAELYVMRLMVVTPSPAALNAQVIELFGFVTW